MSTPIFIKKFLGLQTSVADPEIGSALECKGFAINRTTGRLESAGSYEEVLSSLPGEYLIRSVRALQTFYVPDHGGRTITALSVEMDVRDYGYPVITYKPGVISFVRPYWSGSAWVDAWLALGETRIFHLNTKSGSAPNAQLNLYATGTDGLQAVTDTNYLAGFVLIRNGDFSNPQNFAYATGSSWNGGAPYIRIFGEQTNLALWVNGNDIFAVRSNFGNPLWATGGATHVDLLSQRNVFDEIRQYFAVNDGSATGAVAALFRTKTFAWATGASVDRLVGEAPNAHHASAFGVVEETRGHSSGDPLPAGTYIPYASLQLDDGQETSLRQIGTGVSAKIAEATRGTTSVSVSTRRNSCLALVDSTNRRKYFFAPDSMGGSISKIVVTEDDNGITSQNVSGTITLPLGNALLAGPPASVASRVVGVLNCAGTILAFYTINDGVSTEALYVAEVDALSGAVSRNTKITTTTEVVDFGVANSGTKMLYSAGYVYIATKIGSQAVLFKLDRTTLVSSRVNLGSVNSIPTGMTIDSSYVYVSYELDAPNVIITRVALGLGSQGNLTMNSSDNRINCAAIVGNRLFLGCINSQILEVNAGAWTRVGVFATAAFGNRGALDLVGGGSFLIAGGGDSSGLTYRTTVIDYNSSGTVISSIVDPSSVSIASVFDILPDPDGITFYCMATTQFPNFAIGTAVRKVVWSVGGNFSGSETYRGSVYVSPALLSKRARYINIYLAKNGGLPYRVKQIGLYSGETTFGDANGYWIAATGQHHHRQTDPFEVTGTDLTDSDGSAQSLRGCDPADAGEAAAEVFLSTKVASYCAGRTISGKRFRNKLFVSAISGDGVAMHDIFPNDANSIIDIEGNDGDYVVALAQLGERILVLRSRSILLLSRSGDGYSVDIQSSGVGCISAKTLCVYNEMAIWCDTSGVWSFSANGLRYESEAVSQWIRGYSESSVYGPIAFATIDPGEMLYRLVFPGGIIESGAHWMFCLDLKESRWTMQEMENNNAYVVYSPDVSGQRFMVGNITSVGNESHVMRATNYYYASANLVGSLLWESTKIEIPAGDGYDALLQSIVVEYASDIALTLSLYSGDAVSPYKTMTLPSSKRRVMVPTPPWKRMKKFRIRISGTRTSNGQMVKVYRLGAYYSVVPAGGDRKSETL